MVKRRDVLKMGAVAGGAAVAGPVMATVAGDESRDTMLRFLCPPDGEKPELLTPSPPARPFVAEFNRMPVKQATTAPLAPPPDPAAHQRYEEFPPQLFYEETQNEFRWRYHPDPPYDQGSWSWGFDGITPGPTYHARYGQPILVRRVNQLPPVGQSNVGFALPSTTIHLHNAHTASESDGFPDDWVSPGEFWDHHYANFPSGEDNREKLTTLWYHDHRLDFTAANVYAGLSGFYLLFDENDTGDENDPSPLAWRLPSGEYDVPMILHDVVFDAQGQVRFNSFDTDGILGDRYTVNRVIQPRLEVERRKYRFRILNGGPSRFYQLFLSSGTPFTIISGDGNILPVPVEATSIYLSVGQRVDVILDFSQYEVGDRVTLLNRLEQVNGKGPSGRMLDPGDGIVRFDVVAAKGPDPSRVPATLRELPPVDLADAKRVRTWDFDYDGGLWTINGKIMDSNRIDAGIDFDTAEIWVLRNAGNDWAHPIHSHFTEFIILEVNGRPLDRDLVNTRRDDDHVFVPAAGGPPLEVFMGGPRRDIATLLPGDEIKVFMHWKDFKGKYVMHCHNVVHEDHSMMLRWDIVDRGKGFAGSRSAQEVYGTPEPVIHVEPRPPEASDQEG